MSCTLTLAVICRDEEAVIGRMLDSVQSVCDQVVICDTGSKDRTVEIVKKYPQVEVVHFTWVDDFAGARNHSFSYAKCDLIMWLDCDDYIRPADLEKIKRLKEQDISQLKDCYICKYQYAHEGNDLLTAKVTTSLKRERIFKRSANLKWRYRIHECIPLHVFPQIEYGSDIEVHHYKTAMQYQRAEGRNVRIMRQCVDDPAQTCPRFEFYLGKELVDSSPDEAEKYLKRYIQHPEYYEDHFYALFQLAHIEFNRRNFDKAMEWCMDSLKIDMRRGDVFCFLGLIYINKQRYDLASFWYRVALEMPKPEDSLGFFDMSQHTFIPHFQLGYVYYLDKQYEKSLHHTEIALSYNPHDYQAKNNKKLALAALGRSTVEPKRWAIYIPFAFDINNPNIRLRKVNIQKELKKKNIQADIVKNFHELDNYDFILTHSFFSAPEMNHLKLQGKIVAYDLAEGFFDGQFYNCISEYNLVTCSSSKLTSYCKRFNINAVHLPDSYEAA